MKTARISKDIKIFREISQNYLKTNRRKGFTMTNSNEAKATPRPLEKCLFPNCEKDRDAIAFCKEHSEKHSGHCANDRQGWGIAV